MKCSCKKLHEKSPLMRVSCIKGDSICCSVLWERFMDAFCILFTEIVQEDCSTRECVSITINRIFIVRGQGLLLFAVI